MASREPSGPAVTLMWCSPHITKPRRAPRVSASTRAMEAGQKPLAGWVAMPPNSGRTAANTGAQRPRATNSSSSRRAPRRCAASPRLGSNQASIPSRGATWPSGPTSTATSSRSASGASHAASRRRMPAASLPCRTSSIPLSRTGGVQRKHRRLGRPGRATMAPTWKTCAPAPAAVVRRLIAAARAGSAEAPESRSSQCGSASAKPAGLTPSAGPKNRFGQADASPPLRRSNSSQMRSSMPRASPSPQACNRSRQLDQAGLPARPAARCRSKDARRPAPAPSRAVKQARTSNPAPTRASGTSRPKKLASPSGSKARQSWAATSSAGCRSASGRAGISTACAMPAKPRRVVRSALAVMPGCLGSKLFGGRTIVVIRTYLTSLSRGTGFRYVKHSGIELRVGRGSMKVTATKGESR